MAFVDELTVYIKAGKGGDGVVRWLTSRSKPKGGPAGGNGGNGADVYLEGVRDINLLSKLRYKKEFVAENGGAGGAESLYGRGGEDFIFKLPVGSIVTNTETNESVQVLKEGERILLLKGGRGGLGNEHFKSSTNRAPIESTPGKKGEDGTFYIELQLVADAGFVGFPNAGKSSLLNELTHAEAKIGSYQFTTLDPNLGDMHGYILADIPGLIEGASEGKGLGHKFLRHIQRTKLTLHCVSLENKDLFGAYTTIRKELESLADKDEIIILTKTDLIDQGEVQEKVDLMKKKTGKEVFSVSIIDSDSIKDLHDNLIKVLRDSV